MKKLGDVLIGMAGLLLAGLVAVSVVIALIGGRTRPPQESATATPPLAAPTATKLPGEVDLPFQTIERADTPGTGQNYEGEEPKLIITAEIEEINKIENTVSLDAQKQLHNTDFSEYFPVAVFQGVKPTNMYGAEIRRVSRRGDTVVIYAHFTQRDPEREAADMLTSPYHLVKIRKEGGLQGKIEFILDVDGTVLTQQTHLVP